MLREQWPDCAIDNAISGIKYYYPAPFGSSKKMEKWGRKWCTIAMTANASSTIAE